MFQGFHKHVNGLLPIFVFATYFFLLESCLALISGMVSFVVFDEVL